MGDVSPFEELTTLEVHVDHSVAIITLARPEVLNAISIEMREELLEVLGKLKEHGSTVALITGKGRAFCAGGDVGEMGEERGEEAGRALQDSHRLLFEIERTPIIVIAAVNGLAYGAGFSLALACDMAVASHDAVFSSAFTKAGLVPDMNAVLELGRVLGRQSATYLALTDQKITCEEAVLMGLVADSWPRDVLIEKSTELAKLIADRSTPAIQATKSLMRSAFPLQKPILDLEVELQTRMTGSQEHMEAIADFRRR